MIDRINADMVVVDSEGPDFRVDEVTNRPDLTNRPLRLAGHLLTPLDIGVLCSRGTIAFVSASDMHALGVGFGRERSSRRFHVLREAAGGSCRR
jgi:hypothetical protein